MGGPKARIEATTVAVFVKRLRDTARLLHAACGKLKDVGYMVILGFCWEFDACKLKFKSIGDRVAGCFQ